MLALATLASFAFDSPFDTTPVLDQGTCGSCYAFAATQVFRMRLGSHGPANDAFSPMAMVACNSEYSSPTPAWMSSLNFRAPGPSKDGCNGGQTWEMFEYMKARGVTSCAGKCDSGQCPYSVACTTGTSNKGASGRDCTEGSAHKPLSCPTACGETAAASSPTRYYAAQGSTCIANEGVRLTTTVAAMEGQIRQHGPIAASLKLYDDFDRFWDADPKKVMTSHGSTPHGTHAVVITGYGTNSDGVDYWKVKNSWGSGWADGGYFYLQRGVDMLGIESRSVCFTYAQLGQGGGGGGGYGGRYGGGGWGRRLQTNGSASPVPAAPSAEQEGQTTTWQGHMPSANATDGAWVTVGLDSAHPVFVHLADGEEIEVEVVSAHVQPVAGFMYAIVWDGARSGDASGARRYRSMVHAPPSGGGGAPQGFRTISHQEVPRGGQGAWVTWQLALGLGAPAALLLACGLAFCCAGGARGRRRRGSRSRGSGKADDVALQQGSGRVWSDRL